MKNKSYHENTRYLKKSWIPYKSGNSRHRMLDRAAWLMNELSFPMYLEIKERKMKYGF